MEHDNNQVDQPSQSIQPKREFKPLKNDTILRAARRQPTEYTPGTWSLSPVIYQLQNILFLTNLFSHRSENPPI